MQVENGHLQDGNAANGGDLVKHTVYLSLVRNLIENPTWKGGIKIRECHAGRGLYAPVPGNVDLAHNVMSEQGPGCLLGEMERGILSERKLLPDGTAYAGSALLNAYNLASLGVPATLDLYEMDGAVRRDLSAIRDYPSIRQAISDGKLTVNVLEEGRGEEFDGETYIRDTMDQWGPEDVILLDPFAFWRDDDKSRIRRVRRGLYRDILDKSATTQSTVVIFFTWGNAHLGARQDILCCNAACENGYQQLISHLWGDRRPVVVTWCWRYTFAMWIVSSGCQHDLLVGATKRDLDQLHQHMRHHRKGPDTDWPCLVV